MKKPKAKKDILSHSLDQVARDKSLITPHKNIPLKLVSILVKNGIELFIDIDGEAFRVVTTESNSEPPKNISPEVVSALKDIGCEIIDGEITFSNEAGLGLPPNPEIPTTFAPSLPSITTIKSTNDEDKD